MKMYIPKGSIFVLVLSIVIIIIIYNTIPYIVMQYNGIMYDANTGVIGDTIGGVANPILGSINIALLVYTLLEQIKFNKAQKMASDYNVLMRLRDEISELSKSICVLTHPEISDTKTANKGISYLQELSRAGNYISEEDYNKLREDIMEIIELCLLFFSIEKQSALNEEIKENIRISVWKPFNEAYIFLTLPQDGESGISYSINSANAIPEENDLFEDGGSNSKETLDEKRKNEITMLLRRMDSIRKRYFQNKI